MRNLFFYFLIFCPLFVFITSCQSGNERSSMGDDAMYEMQALPEARQARSLPTSAEESMQQTNSASQNETTEKRIIKTASLRIQVQELEKSRNNVNELIKKHNAYISSENTVNTGSILENHIVIRVQHASFDALVDDLTKEAAYLSHKNISSQDVTEEFVDIEARLKTKKQVENRYRELLAKAKTVEDILKIENELRVIREEIEAREGRLNYLKNQIQHSTINLDMYQELAYKATPKFSFFSRVADAFRKGWDGFVSFFVGLIYIWPFVILLIVILILVRKKWGTGKRKNS